MLVNIDPVMSADFFSQCGPVLVDVDDYPSLTKANYNGITPQWIQDRKNDGYLEAAFLYRQALMGGVSGVRESCLLDLLLSRAKGKESGVHLTEQKIGASKSFFLPYILREKKDIINASAFVIESGTVNTNAGTTVDGITYHDGSWEVTVTNSNAELISSNIKNIERYFLPGEHVVVLNLSDSGAAQEPFFVIEHAINANSGGVEKAKVYIKPLITETTWGTYTAGQKAPFQPTAGVVQIGANSVSDYEAWCHNQPTNMSNRLQAYWFGTARFTRTWDDEYEKFVKYIFEGKVNLYLEKFKQLDITTQNREMYQLFLRKWMTSVFFGQPISEHQTVEAYQQLPQVNDPRGSNSFLHYKANPIGIYPQLNACNRVIDNQGQALNFNVLEEQLYALKRYREGRTGKTVEDIDVMVDRGNFNRIKSIMFQYYKKKYGTSPELHFGPNDPIKFDAAAGKTMWMRQSYELDDVGVVLHVIQEPWMTDFRTHFPSSIRNRGNFMFFVDWSDFTLGIADTARRKSKTPDLETDPDYKCIIKANYSHVDMESFTWTAMVGDENSHLIYTNFSDECPRYTAQVCAADESSTSNSVS
jgi:hypothetical protein